MDFYDASRIVARTKRRLKHKSSVWSPVHTRLQQAGDCSHWLLDGDGEEWWPTPEQQKEKSWEVEPEEIIVWGTCEANGDSWIWGRKPIKHRDINMGWNSDSNEGGGRHLLTPNLFPKDKSIKFKLVPVDDNE